MPMHGTRTTSQPQAIPGFHRLVRTSEVILCFIGYTSRIMTPWKLTRLKPPGVGAGIGVGIAASMLGTHSAKKLSGFTG